MCCIVIACVGILLGILPLLYIVVQPIKVASFMITVNLPHCKVAKAKYEDKAY